jgi:hypothetical protein
MTTDSDAGASEVKIRRLWNLTVGKGMDGRDEALFT